MSWIDELSENLERSVRTIEAQLVSRTPRMLRGAVKPLSPEEVRNISWPLACAIANAILKAQAEAHRKVA